MLSERNQTQKTTCLMMILFIYYSGKDKIIETETSDSQGLGWRRVLITNMQYEGLF